MIWKWSFKQFSELFMAFSLQPHLSQESSEQQKQNHLVYVTFAHVVVN